MVVAVVAVAAVRAAAAGPVVAAGLVAAVGHAAAAEVGHDREAVAHVHRQGDMCLKKCTLRRGLRVSAHFAHTYTCITQIRHDGLDRYTHCDGEQCAQSVHDKKWAVAVDGRLRRTGTHTHAHTGRLCVQLNYQHG
jgi:hypothetical protein